MKSKSRMKLIQFIFTVGQDLSWRTTHNAGEPDQVLTLQFLADTAFRYAAN